MSCKLITMSKGISHRRIVMKCSGYKNTYGMISRIKKLRITKYFKLIKINEPITQPNAFNIRWHAIMAP